MVLKKSYKHPCKNFRNCGIKRSSGSNKLISFEPELALVDKEARSMAREKENVEK